MTTQNSNCYADISITKLQKAFQFIIILILLSIGVTGITRIYAFPKAPKAPEIKPPCIKLLTDLERRSSNKRAYKRQLKFIKRKFPSCFTLSELTNSIEPDESFISSLLKKELISQEILTTFTKDAFLSAQEIGYETEGKVLEVHLLDDPVIFGKWMEVRVAIKTEKFETEYLIVFHLENSKWKIFGTQAL